jgi:hypothetical protein
MREIVGLDASDSSRDSEIRERQDYIITNYLEK